VTILALWAVARFVAAFTWRDAHVFGALCVEQLVLLGLLAILAVGLLTPPGVRWVRREWTSRRGLALDAGG
jgi:hypothetical protein